MEQTRKGSFWKLAQSWWVLLTFTIFFNWIAFFYISARTKYKRWALWGLVYSIPFFTLITDRFKSDSWQFDVLMTSMCLGTLFSIIHAFKIRKEYLLRLEARQLSRKQASKGEDDKLKSQIEAEYGVNLSTPAPATPAKQAEQPPAAKKPAAAAKPPEKSSAVKPAAREPQPQSAAALNAAPVSDPARQQPPAAVPVPEPAMAKAPAAPPVQQQEPAAANALELNAATEEEIAALPGVGIILAKKAVSIRQTKGGFRSVDEFIEGLGLKPHQIERIRTLVTVRPAAPVPPQPNGRVVDF